jgi:S1-C subfamily serine protease
MVNSGLRVIRLDENGPAAAAGICGPKLSVFKQGPFTIQSIDITCADIITGIDNIAVHSADDLLSYLELQKPGQVVTLTVLRGEHKIKIPVKLKTANTI